MNNKNIKTIAIASGKGGVGKSLFTLNLAQALSRTGKRVTALDADFSLANLHVLLGLQPKKNIADVLSQRCSMEDVLLTGPDHVRIIPGARGLPILSSPSNQMIYSLIQAVDSLADSTDILLIDTAGNLSTGELQLVSACKEVIILITPSLISLNDSISYIKQLHKRYKISHFHVIANMVKGYRQGMRLIETFNKQLGFDQSIVVNQLAILPFDPSIDKASNYLMTVLQSYPESRLSKDLEKIAQTIITQTYSPPSHGGIKFFLENNLVTGGN